MCGRYSLVSPSEKISRISGAINLGEFPPRYNIAPTQPILTLGLNPGVGNSLEPQGNLVRWGLIPHWVKDPNDFTLIINARSETASSKASFKTALRHKRVLIPADGFYEWHRPQDKSQPKQAYWITPADREPVFFAGIVDTWMGADGSEMDSGCILTTESNTQIGNIHHRMPVVIQPDDFERWLDCKTQEPRDVADLMSAAEDGFFEAIAVSDLVNKVTNTGPEIQQPGSASPATSGMGNGKGKRKGNRKAVEDSKQMDLF